MNKKLFGSKNRVKLLEFFILQNGEGKLREISRKLKMSVSVVSNELKNFVGLGIVKKIKDDFVLNKSCIFSDDLGNVLLKSGSFISEFEKIFKKGDFDFVFVFGSFANKNYSNESDVDLFVVGKVSTLNVNKLVRPLEKKLNREINSVVWTLNDLKKKSNSSFLKQISKNNIIMIKGDENELRKII
jgi:predicted nucleotidyltransferase